VGVPVDSRELFFKSFEGLPLPLKDNEAKMNGACRALLARNILKE
jgi:hypothetical protein